MKKTMIWVLLLAALLLLTACAAKEEAAVTGITVDASNAKYWYVSGQEIDPTGLVVTATLADGTTKTIPVSEYTIEKPRFMPYGEKKVAVQYGEWTAAYTIYTCPTMTETDDYTTFQVRANENGSQVSLTPVLVGENKPFVLVCPGGGYEACSAYGNEGYAYAARIKELGYNAFILQYSIKMAHPTPLDDVNLALDIIEQNSEYWQVSTENYAVIGSSAGAHLVGCWSTPEIGFQKYGKSKPAAAILCYPLISLSSRSDSVLLPADADEALIDSLCIDRHVDSSFPPTYMWIFEEDSLKPQVDRMDAVLEENNVPHITRYYTGGRHGLGLAPGTAAEGWLDEAVAFWIDHIQ